MDLLALTLLTLSLWAPPAVRGACVDDDETAFFDDECRTSDRFSADHILPPDWGLLLDSYDFSGLVGTTTVQQWRTLDVDGINEAGISTSSPQGIWSENGGTCQHGLRICSITLPSQNQQNNWIFSDYIRFPSVPNVDDVQEVFFNMSFRFTQCVTPCVNSYATLYRYDVNAPVSADQRVAPSNYQLLGGIADSRLNQATSPTSNANSVWSISRPATNGFYLAFRDEGNCGNINRVYVYYRRSPGYTGTLVTCPSVPFPIQGSTSTTRGTCCCGLNAENKSTLDRICSADGSCVDPATDVCGCSPGFEFINGVCQACPAGMFQPDISITSSCVACPANSAALLPASGVCDCTGATVRNPAMPSNPCAEPPSSPLLTVGPVVDDTVVTVCWGSALNTGGLDDLHYNVYLHQVGMDGAMYNKVNDNPITGSGELCYEISELNPSSSYAVVVTSANGATGDPPTLDQQLSSVQGQFVAYFVDTGEPEPLSSPLLTVGPVVDGTFVTVCWGSALNTGGLDDLHYNVYVRQVGIDGAMYNKVNDNPITGSGELCHDIFGLNLSSSYAVVVTSANGATGDPPTLDQQLSSVQGQFVAYFVDTGEPEPPSPPLLTVGPVVDGTVVTVCWGSPLNTGGLDDLHYNVYIRQVGMDVAMYNKVNDNPITGSGELCHDISGLNLSSSYAVVVTSANGATGDPPMLDQQLSSVQGQFVVYFVDTGEPGLRKGDAIALTFFMTLIFVALVTAAIVITVMWFVCVKRNATMATSPKTNGDHSMSDYKVGNTAKVETTPSTHLSRPPRPPTKPKV